MRTEDFQTTSQLEAACTYRTLPVRTRPHTSSTFDTQQSLVPPVCLSVTQAVLCLNCLSMLGSYL